MHIETSNTKRAREQLQKLISKPIIVRPISELRIPGKKGPVTYLGACCEEDSAIRIWCSDKCPEATFVHEILHRILEYEGFPRVDVSEEYLTTSPPRFINAVMRLRDNFSSTIEHPEVFRRMREDYKLDLPHYYHFEVKQKLHRFKVGSSITVSHPEYYFHQQQDILIGLDFYLWGNQAKVLFDVFRQVSPEAFKACEQLHGILHEVGFSTPDQMAKSAQLIHGHIIEFGHQHNLKAEFQDMWKAIIFIQ